VLNRLKYTLLIIALTFCLSSFFSAGQTHSAASLSGAEPDPSSLVPASHKEIGTIGSTPETKFDRLITFCMDPDGNLLACDGNALRIRKISPAGKTLAKWDLEFAPYAVHACPDGTAYVAGTGTIAHLDKKGDVLKRIQSDGENFPSGRPSGVAVTKKNVFLAVGSGWSLRSKSTIIRFDRNLGNPKIIAEGLRGCCQRLDLVANDSNLYVAENSRYRVLKCDRNGKVLSDWGSKDRTRIEGFGSCCNPMNLCFGANGDLYTAESGLGRIKRYTPDGKFLGLVGYVGVDRFNRAGRLAASCSNISIAISNDASRVYVLDYMNNIIRVMAKQDAKPTD